MQVPEKLQTSSHYVPRRLQYVPNELQNYCQPDVPPDDETGGAAGVSSAAEQKQGFS